MECGLGALGKGTGGNLLGQMEHENGKVMDRLKEAGQERGNPTCHFQPLVSWGDTGPLCVLFMDASWGPKPLTGLGIYSAG